MTEFERGWKAACAKLAEAFTHPPIDDTDDQICSAVKTSRAVDVLACEFLAQCPLDESALGVAPTDRPLEYNRVAAAVAAVKGGLL